MEKKASEVMKLLEISHLAGREVIEMSSGEARRVVIGRALVHDPKALAFDEPANSLDFHATRELRSILRKLAQAGTSMILVTHHLPDIIPEIERVVLFGARVEVVHRDGYYHLR
jgi:iron complex transport system ATP-binding protein